MGSDTRVVPGFTPGTLKNTGLALKDEPLITT